MSQARRPSLSRFNTALRRAKAALDGSRGRALEVGCGSGRFLRALCSSVPHLQGHGCDIDERALAGAVRSGDGCHYLRANMTHLPYASASFQVVLAFDVLEHLADPSPAVAEIARVLQPGGIFHGLVPCEAQPFTLHRA